MDPSQLRMAEITARSKQRLAVKALRDTLAANDGDLSKMDEYFYTSPRALHELLAGRIFGESYTECNSHELYLVPNQHAWPSNDKMSISCVCGNCRYHFHIKHDSEFSQAFDNCHEQKMHMFVVYHRSSMKQAGFVSGRVHMSCIVKGCGCNLELTLTPPLISREVVDKFQDPQRTYHNLLTARSREPVRFQGLSDQFGANAAFTFMRYLTDGLSQRPDEPRKKIKKQNKKFIVCFGADFDDLLKLLGFSEGEVDGEACWWFPQLEPQAEHTPVGTWRACWEDVLAELMVMQGNRGNDGQTLHAAWDVVETAFRGSYQPTRRDSSCPSQADAAVIGCLNDYKPEVFSWVARVLTENYRELRDQWMSIAHRCINNRSEDVDTALVMWNSGFEQIDTVATAFKYFDANPGDGKSSDYFLSKYYVFATANLSDALRAEAQQQLDIVGNYLGVDIVSQINPAVLDDMIGPVQQPNGRMPIGEAMKILGVETNYTAEIVRGFVNNLAQKTSIDREKTAKALEAFAAYKRDDMSLQDREKEADALQAMAGIFRGDATFVQSTFEPEQTVTQAITPTAPPGLENIGNTCYLNSLLQYFYHVILMRELILNYQDYALELDDGSLQERRTGGSGAKVKLDEAVVARQFVEELRKLFRDLQTTTGAACKPSQKLANTALKTATALLEEPETKPPPLPKRPSPAPPTDPVKKDDGVNVTVEAVMDNMDTSSQLSSETLVNDAEGNPSESYVTVNMPDAEDDKAKNVVSRLDDLDAMDTDAKSQDDKVKEDASKSDVPDAMETDSKQEADDKPDNGPVDMVELYQHISERLERSDRKGTDQQDVGEIIGNIFEHLHRAFRSEGPMPDRPDLQADEITKMFFSMLVNYTVTTKNGVEANTRKEVIPDRYITAFPHKTEPCTLYEALHRMADSEIIDQDKENNASITRYTTVRSLPPILHIFIQRSGNQKNRNPVTIPEVLYMDRFMDVEPDSELYKMRLESWMIKEDIARLQEQVKKNPEHVVTPKAMQTVDNVDNEMNGVEPDSEPDAPHDLTEEPPDMSFLNEFSSGSKANTTPEVLTPDKRTGSKTSLTKGIEESPTKKQKTATPTSPAPETADSSGTAVGSSTPKFAEAEMVPYLAELTKNIVEEDKNLLQRGKEKVESYFSSLREHKYRLHAVICHGGGVQAGHYWVWIFDFKKNKWLKFNDSRVTEDSRESQEVLDELNGTGDPYYLAYVRDEKKDELVDVPPRAVAPTAEAAQTTQATQTVQIAQKDTQDVEMQTIEGVEPTAETDGDEPPPSLVPNPDI